MDAYSFLLQAGAVASVSLTVTRSKLFKPIQKYELFRCPYCFSHWVALAVTFSSWNIIRAWPVYWWALVAASALIMGAISRLFLSQETKIQELEAEVDHLTGVLGEFTK